MCYRGWGLEHHVISRKADHGFQQLGVLSSISADADGEHGTRVTFLPIQFFKRADPIERKKKIQYFPYRGAYFPEF